jgi:hypothetical protein
LREITRKVRPDYRIDTPELRGKWEAGDKKEFYPYGKSWKQVFARMAGAGDQFEDPEERESTDGDARGP